MARAGNEAAETRVISDASAFEAAFGVSRETTLRLERYAALLARWQGTINLVSTATLDQVWHRHFGDSAQLLGLAERGCGSIDGLGAGRIAAGVHWLDLGSGAGFPGLVVAIMLAERGGGRATLMESDARKCAFLREVARETLAGEPMAVDIRHGRIEAAANQARLAPVDVISARALAPLPRLLELAGPFFGPQTLALFPKGREAAAETAAAQAAAGPRFVYSLAPSLTEADAAVVGVMAAG